MSEETSDTRSARTVRLEPVVEAKLQHIASEMGITLNAAVSVAISFGYNAMRDARVIEDVTLPRTRTEDP